MIINKDSNYYNQQRLYKDLAWLFPIISPPEDYLEESDILVNYIKQAAKRPVQSLLNLGCGAGHNDFRLKKYFRVTGIDLSKTMLAMARHLNPEVTYELGDYTKLALNKLFDTITVLDAVDYIVDENKLQQLIKMAYDHLNPGGVLLIFPDELKEELRNNNVFSSSHHQEDIEVTYVEHVYDPDPNDTVYEVTYIYLIRQAGELKVEVDHHCCGLFSLEIWRKLFKSVGFSYQEQVFIPHDGQDRRYKVFLGIKPT